MPPAVRKTGGAKALARCGRDPGCDRLPPAGDPRRGRAYSVASRQAAGRSTSSSRRAGSARSVDAPGPGRAVTWGTTAGFLEHFGLAGLAELPGLDELEAAGLIDTRPASAVAGVAPRDDDDEAAAGADSAAGAQARPVPRSPGRVRRSGTRRPRTRRGRDRLGDRAASRPRRGWRRRPAPLGRGRVPALRADDAHGLARGGSPAGCRCCANRRPPRVRRISDRLRSRRSGRDICRKQKPTSRPNAWCGSP